MLTQIIIELRLVLIGLREVMTMSNETLIINIVVVVAIVSVLVILDAFSGGQLFFGNGVF
jgi:hypothetical protein